MPEIWEVLEICKEHFKKNKMNLPPLHDLQERMWLLIQSSPHVLVLLYLMAGEGIRSMCSGRQLAGNFGAIEMCNHMK